MLRHYCLIAALINLITLLTAIAKSKGSIFCVTGATGVLGTALSNVILNNQHHLYASYQSKSQALLYLNKFEACKDKKLQMFNLDLLDDHLELPLGSCSSLDHLILINCAGILLDGNDHSAIRRQIIINSISPVKLCLAAIGLCQRMKSKLTIVNISSGDGESLFLHSSIWNEIRNLQSIDDWFNYTLSFTIGNSFDPKIEYATGSSPGYSLSKALLNRASILLQQKCKENERVISVCPGNFVSPLSSNEELSTSVPVHNVAQSIYDTIMDEEIRGGLFYRNKEVIPW